MKAKTFYYVMKRLSYGGIIIFLMLAVFNLGTAYGETGAYGEGPLEWGIKERSHKWDQDREEMPQELRIFRGHFDNIRRNIWLALGFLVAFYCFDVCMDYKSHKLIKLIRRLSKSGNSE